MIKDITVSYSGMPIRVIHSVYKPFPFIPGLIRYTFLLPGGKVTIQRNYNRDERRLCWVEVNKGETEIAKELGEAYENFYLASGKNVINISEIIRLEALKNKHTFRYNYGDAV